MDIPHPNGAPTLMDPDTWPDRFSRRIVLFGSVGIPLVWGKYLIKYPPTYIPRLDTYREIAWSLD